MTMQRLFTTEDFAAAKKAALRLRALNNKTRARVFAYVVEKGETSVTPIYKYLRLEQSICSMHLKLLRDARLVTVRREGKERIYSVNWNEYGAFITLCRQLVK